MIAYECNDKDCKSRLHYSDKKKLRYLEWLATLEEEADDDA